MPPVIYLKCTSEVQKAIGLSKAQLAEPVPVGAPLGSWYVHRFAVGRTHFYLFMSEVTLLSFVLYQGRKKMTLQVLPGMFMAGLSQLLTIKGYDDVLIDQALQGCETGLFAKTDSRKLLGCMNDLVRCYSTMVEAQGGLDACDLTGIILKLNDMPQRTLNWRSSWDMTWEVISGFPRTIQ